MAPFRKAALWLFRESGIKTVLTTSYDARILLTSRFIRMFAYGSSTLILALYFQALGHSDAKLGLFITLTLLGDVLVSLLLTAVADSIGRRQILLLGALLMTASGVVFATSSNYWVLLVAAVVGVISPSGNEIGPFRTVEESTLAHLVESEVRSDIFAWYVMIGTLGTAIGTFSCGWVVQHLQGQDEWTVIDAYRVVFWVYAGLGVSKALLALLLSRRCEYITHKKDISAPASQETAPLLRDGTQSQNGTSDDKPNKEKKRLFSHISEESWGILIKLCLLFAMDSLASGMVPFSLITYFMNEKFHIPQGKLGSIMSITWFFSTLSNIFSSAISRRIGPVKTMVFTHLPSAIILALIPAPSSLGLTVFFLAARSSIASMDQAPRSTFLSAIMLPHERTAVMGIVNVVKTFSQSGGPVITGVLSNRGKFWVAFVVAGALKASYDLGLLTVFLGANLKRGDEQATETAPAEGNQAGEHGVESRDTRTIPGEASVISIVENRRGTKPILI